MLLPTDGIAEATLGAQEGVSLPPRAKRDTCRGPSSCRLGLLMIWSFLAVWFLLESVRRSLELKQCSCQTQGSREQDMPVGCGFKAVTFQASRGMSKDTQTLLKQLPQRALPEHVGMEAYYEPATYRSFYPASKAAAIARGTAELKMNAKSCGRMEGPSLVRGIGCVAVRILSCTPGGCCGGCCAVCFAVCCAVQKDVCRDWACCIGYPPQCRLDWLEAP